jgi:Zn-finger nucleic acid-binding protein
MTPLCPRCVVVLDEDARNDIPRQACSRCGGMWIAASQLRDLVESVDPDRDVEEMVNFRLTSLRWEPAPAPKIELACPECCRALEPFNYACDSGIILEKCRYCKCVWLDAGALEKVQMVVAASS